jgi:hypothetical protein
MWFDTADPTHRAASLHCVAMHRGCRTLHINIFGADYTSLRPLADVVGHAGKTRPSLISNYVELRRRPG